MKEIYEKLFLENSDRVIIIKNGLFYNVANGDAYIFNYLFDYKVVNKDFNFDVASFPTNSLVKVKKALKERNIGYILVNGINEVEIGDTVSYNTLLSIGYRHYYKVRMLNNLLKNIKKIDEKELLEFYEKWKI